MTQDEVFGWHHRLDGDESEQALGVCEGLEAWCAAVHVVTESDMTEEIQQTHKHYKEKECVAVVTPGTSECHLT